MRAMRDTATAPHVGRAVPAGDPPTWRRERSRESTCTPVTRRRGDDGDTGTRDGLEDAAPHSLTAILDPAAALAAAQRMQRFYQSAQGSHHTQFGRDGRRVEGRLLADAYFDATA
jgi:hypothetical protein